ncbi:MAG: DUF6527 family protein [Myxococcota bacterium]
MNRRIQTLAPEFVDFIPDELHPGVLYVSVRFKSVQHLCCCGCGRKVVTPLSPTGWQMQFDGRAISLHPSVGSWQKECKSHYFIIENQVRWAPRWSEDEISRGLKKDGQAKADYYTVGDMDPPAVGEPRSKPPKRAPIAEAWRELKHKLFSKPGPGRRGPK